MRIVKATVEDAKVILAIQKEAFTPEGQLAGSMNIPPLTQTLDELVSEFDNYDAFKAVNDTGIIGAVRGNAKGDTGYISRLMVGLDHQNLGIGAMLMEALETHLIDTYQIKRLELFTGKACEKSLYFYKKLGYRIFKEDLESQDVALVYMEKTV